MTQIKLSWIFTILQVIEPSSHQTFQSSSQVMKFLTAESELCQNLNSVLGRTIMEQLEPVVTGCVCMDKRLAPPLTPPQNNLFWCRNGFLYVHMSSKIATNLVTKIHRGFKAQVPPTITHTKAGRAGNKSFAVL